MPEGAHTAPITSVALRRDGRMLATTSYDGMVLLWDVARPQSPRVAGRLAHRRLVNSATWNPHNENLLATASADKTIAVWDVSDPARPVRINVLARHTDDINSVAWMPDGEQLVAVSEDGRATLWNAVRGTFGGAIAAHAAHCMMVDVSPDGLIATVGEDGLVAVRALDGSTRRERTYDSSVEGCAWSNDGQLLALAKDDGSVDVLDTNLDVVFSTRVASSATRSVSWSDDDSLLLVGAYDGAVHLLDRAGVELTVVHDERFWPRSVSAAGSIVAVGSFWGAPHLLSLPELAIVFDPLEPTLGVNAVVLSGSDLALGDDSGRIVITGDDPSPTLIRESRKALTPTASPILSLAADAGRVWAGTYAGYVINASGSVRSEDLGAPIPSLIAHGDAVVAGTYNGELVELDPATLSVLRRRPAYDGSIKSLCSVPGAGVFASASTDRIVGIGTFDARTVLWEHGNLVNSVAVAANARVVASASRDHTVKVGLLDDDLRAERIVSLLAADESVKAVAVLGTPERPVVLGGSYDFGVYAWHVDWDDHSLSLRGGTPVKMLGQGVSTIVALDAERAVVVGWDGSLVFFELDGETLVEVADHDLTGRGEAAA